MKRMMRYTALALFISLAPFTVLGTEVGPLDQLVQRLSPIEGTIIGKIQGVLFVIDIGRRRGVKPGDLFSAYKPIRQLKSPTTGKSITLWSRPLSCLEAFRVEEEYSLAKVVKGEQDLKVNWKVSRFKGMKAYYKGTGEGEKLVGSYLKTRLSHMVWSKDPITGPCTIKINKSREAIEVLAGPDRVLAYYVLRSATSSRTKGNSPPSSIYTESTVEKKEAYAPFYRCILSLNEPIFSMDLGETASLGIPVVVYHNGKELVLAVIQKGQFNVLDRFPYQGMGELLNLYVGDCNGDGLPEVAVNTFIKDEGPDSFILQIKKDGKFAPFLDHIPYFLAMEDQNGDGDRETLLAQGYEEESLFAGSVYKVELRSQGYHLTKEILIPHSFRIPASFIGDVDGDGGDETIFTSSTQKLFICKGSNKLWSSRHEVGGSLITAQVRVGQGEFYYEKPVSIDPPLLIYDVDGDGEKEILVVRNISRLGNIIGDLSPFSGGEVVMVKKEKVGYVTRPFTGELDGPIQSISIYKGELWCTMIRGAYKHPKSYILAFPLSTSTPTGLPFRQTWR